MKIAFVILNYNTYEETKEGILSIEDKLDTKDYRIVIVDNCSTDDSVEKIEKFIRDKEQIKLIRNSENLGFARGNNIGIAYANENYNPEFVVVCNSDIELMQYNLVARLDKEYQESGFALLGPLVLTGNNRYDTSPMAIPTACQIKVQAEDLKRSEILFKTGMYYPYRLLYYLKKRICPKSVKDNISDQSINPCKYQKQVIINGCFMVFSKKFFDYFDGFDERTFLFYEETILYLKIMKTELVTVYEPQIMVYHKGEAAFASFLKTRRSEMLFKIKYKKKSAEVLLSEISENEIVKGEN